MRPLGALPPPHEDSELGRRESIFNSRDEACPPKCPPSNHETHPANLRPVNFSSAFSPFSICILGTREACRIHMHCCPRRLGCSCMIVHIPAAHSFHFCKPRAFRTSRVHQSVHLHIVRHALNLSNSLCSSSPSGHHHDRYVSLHRCSSTFLIKPLQAHLPIGAFSTSCTAMAVYPTSNVQTALPYQPVFPLCDIYHSSPEYITSKDRSILRNPQWGCIQTRRVTRPLSAL